MTPSPTWNALGNKPNWISAEWIQSRKLSRVMLPSLAPNSILASYHDTILGVNIAASVSVRYSEFPYNVY